MGKAYKAPTLHVTAITMRKRESRPIIFPLGVHTSDDSNIDTTLREAVDKLDPDQLEIPDEIVDPPRPRRVLAVWDPHAHRLLASSSTWRTTLMCGPSIAAVHSV